jgi:hypothetical protein
VIFVEFKQCTKLVQVAHKSAPMWGLDIIYVDTPSGEADKKSSSYNLSIFSSGANSKGAEVIASTYEDSSPSIRDVWPNIDKLDDLAREDTSVVHARNALVHGKRSATSIENASKRSRREGKKDSLTDVAGTSNIRSKRHRGSSTRREAARIMFAAPGVISPCMRRSFVDRQYSPSTGMGLSEWEVILDELIRMGYIVKKEHDDEHNG